MIELLSTVLLLWGTWGKAWGTSAPVTPLPTNDIIADDTLADDVLAAVCEDGVLANGEGCATCPTMTSFAGEEGPFLLENIYEGAFSSPGLDEFIASFSGCEPGFGGGGKVLLGPEPMDDGSFVFVQAGYFPRNLDVTGCTVARFPDDGATDELFCELLFVAQGMTETLLINYDFFGAELFSYTMARATDFSSFGCLESSRLESSYTVSYPGPYSVEVELTRQEAAYPSPSCERVALSDPETLSYTWNYAGAAWVLQPLNSDVTNGVLSFEQYQEAERQIQEGEIDDTLAAYLSGRIDAEQFAALF